MNRREVLGTAGIAAGAAALDGLLAPVKAIAADAKPIRIKNVETFNIEIPATPDGGRGGRHEPHCGSPRGDGVRCSRIFLRRGRRGWRGRPRRRPGWSVQSSCGLPVDPRGVDWSRSLCVEQHLKRGLINWGGIEEALWDAIGKVANQPVYRLLGGSKTSIPVYITAVWRGNADQSQVPIKDQAVYARRLKDAGFTGFKMRIFRPNFMDDVESCAGIIAACGPAPGFKVMVDRTAHLSGKVWDYPTGLAAAKALQEAGVYWLEEPFSQRRLRRSGAAGSREWIS